jgi:surface antigen
MQTATVEGVATTVRVTQETRERAAALARATGVTIGQVIEHALEAYETQRFWEQTREALAEAPAERDVAWDAADRDGLDRD